jgi:hypothetical protein
MRLRRYISLQKSKPFIVLLLVLCACNHGYTQTSNLRKHLNEKIWNTLFPNRIGVDASKKNKTTKDFYSFKDFLSAADSFPMFLSDPDPVIQKRELCAFLANIAYETGGGWNEALGGCNTKKKWRVQKDVRNTLIQAKKCIHP